MNDKYSIASKARWASIPVEVRKDRMAAIAKAKWQKMSDKDRSAHGKMMRSNVGKKVV